jgi:hypothetical protein
MRTRSSAAIVAGFCAVLASVAGAPAAEITVLGGMEPLH